VAREGFAFGRCIFFVVVFFLQETWEKKTKGFDIGTSTDLAKLSCARLQLQQHSDTTKGSATAVLMTLDIVRSLRIKSSSCRTSAKRVPTHSLYSTVLAPVSAEKAKTSKSLLSVAQRLRQRGVTNSQLE
jgi:hypothetical protein